MSTKGAINETQKSSWVIGGTGVTRSRLRPNITGPRLPTRFHDDGRIVSNEWKSAVTRAANDDSRRV